MSILLFHLLSKPVAIPQVFLIAYIVVLSRQSLTQYRQVLIVHLVKKEDISDCWQLYHIYHLKPEFGICG